MSGQVHKLIIEDDEGKTIVYPLARSEVSIGRRETNTIRLMERNVSRHHARLARREGAVFVEDLDSYNGVRVNGERISNRCEVAEGDLVQIGDYHLALKATEITEEDPGAGAEEAATEDVAAEPPFEQKTLIDQPALTKETLEVGDEAAAAVALATPEPELAPGKASGRFDETTRPLRVAPPRTSEKVRLVCVSTEYAGRDYEIESEETVIGRVEDNDIVVEHRSVSRNHAKITFDGLTHRIADMESANGVLVNGDEYARTELRAGDVIELGHVLFRFLPAGTVFSPNEDEIRAMQDAGVLWQFDLSEVATERPQNAVEETQRMEIPSAITPADTFSDTSPHEAETVRVSSEALADVHEDVEPEIGPPAEVIASRAMDPATDETEAFRPQAHSLAERKNGGAWGLIAILGLILLSGTAYVFSSDLGKKDPSFDQTLQQLFQEEKYDEVVSYYQRYEASFAEPGRAGLTVGRAEERLSQKAEEVSEVADSDSQRFVLPEADDGVRAEEDLESEVDVRTKKRRDRPRGRRSKRQQRLSAAKAKSLAEEGAKQLILGRMPKAEDLLAECVQISELPECHRSLGVLYAETDRPELSVRHYNTYVRLAPDAKDAEQVRALIREADQ